jgi:hypothetical protein
MREAKTFIGLNPDIFDDDGDGIVDFQEHAVEYLKNNWEGWVNQKHPCGALLRNYNSFAPKKVRETVKRIQMIACPDCETPHKATEVCPRCHGVNA